MQKTWQFIGLGAILTAAVCLRVPAVAKSFAELVSCSTFAACEGGNNTGSGPGVRGDAERSAGIFGRSRTGNGVAGYSAGHVGVYGASSGSRGHSAVYGVYGFSHNVGVGGYGTGTGVQGISSAGSGIYGQTDALSGSFRNPPPIAGVYGYDSTGNNAGVIGSSANGVGVIGQISGVNPCNPGPAVEGFSTGASGWLGVTAITGFCQNFPLAGAMGDANVGVVGMGETQFSTPLGDPYRFGIGLQASGDVGAVISGSGVPNASTGVLPPALEVQENGKGLVLSAIGPSGVRILSLDANGNLIVSGKVTQRGRPEGNSGSNSPLAETSLAGNERSPTIESVGEAQLANGASSVRMSAEFAADIDPSARYQVLVTPEGPTAGLYVTQKSVRGFLVRENPGGHSNAAFSYRIVAKAMERSSSRALLANQRYAGAISTKLVQRMVQKLKLSRPRPDKRIVPPSIEGQSN